MPEISTGVAERREVVPDIFGQPQPPDLLRGQSFSPRLTALKDQLISPEESPDLKVREVSKFDKIGVGLSALCAVKCVGLPLLAGVLPVAGLASWSHHPAVVWTVAGLALPLAATKLIHAELKKGRYVTPALAYVSGMSLIFGAVGHSIPAEKNAVVPVVAGCGCGCGAHLAVQNPEAPRTFNSVIRANAHSSLLYGALGLGLLHLNRLRRQYSGKKAACQGGENCKCSD